MLLVGFEMLIFELFKIFAINYVACRICYLCSISSTTDLGDYQWDLEIGVNNLCYLLYL